METIVEALRPWKQPALAFLRVFVATVVACWVNAGLPVLAFSPSELLGWVELGVQAGAMLVIANYLGPWEQRYGVKVLSRR